MGNRIYDVQAAVLATIEDSKIPDDLRDETVGWEKLHMASSAQIGAQLARLRGTSASLAACACSLHDIGRIVSGKQAGHAEAGYELAKDLLHTVGGFSEEEIEEIALAVKNHSKKAEVGLPLEEIVKDADILDMDYYGRELPREEQKQRLENLKKEIRKCQTI
jgi:uncharacterized protein